jgi:hypothetical protein
MGLVSKVIIGLNCELPSYIVPCLKNPANFGGRKTQAATTVKHMN